MNLTDSSRQFALEIVQKLQESGYAAYWAGGCVRDILLGKKPKDYDVATDARPETVREIFGYSRTYGIGAAFGVILVHGRGGAGDVEVATFRVEGPYLDGRRPEKVVFCTPEEDALRRDFTINGMFLNPVTDELLDYVGGEQDLERKIVRAIGDPVLRFQEDKLRLLRGVRFTALLQFQLDDLTARAIQASAKEIHAVSPERITQEMRRMLESPQRQECLVLLRELGLLSEILPEISPLLDESCSEDWNRTCQRLGYLTEPGFPLAMGALLFDLHDFRSEDAAILARRLRWSNQEREQLQWILASRNALEGIEGRRLSYQKKLLVHPLARSLLQLVKADLQTRQASLDSVEFCEKILEETPVEILAPPPLLTGNDLIAGGIQPGPRFKDLLDQVRDAQLELKIQSRDEAWELIRRLL